ncbi:MAG: flavodoxin FldA [Marinifilaceae bacterium]|jgi:flavodoxin I|nr:flavodoxin FldA [Marinifilaceae bacterium]
MGRTAVFYGSTMGNTESVANRISAKLGAECFNISDITIEKLIEYDNLVLGSSTWGIGDLQDDWESFLPELDGADLSGKKIAIFGCGDGSAYSDSFVDAIGKIHAVVSGKNCEVLGSVDSSDYEFDASEAEEDGKFYGLAIDEDNQSDMTEERITNWVKVLEESF